MDAITLPRMTCIVQYLLFVFISLPLLQMCECAGNLDRCLKSKHHKISPGTEDSDFSKYHCTPWSGRSCCTSKTSQAIQQDGVLTLYNMKWDHCSRNISSKCREWFKRDTCFYECSPNVGPWIVIDRRSKITRRERIINVPLCGDDCESWFDACKNDLTCSDNWNKHWQWTKEGNLCIKKCKSFQEYFGNAQNFCNKIFDDSFEYTKGVAGKDCFSLWPKISKAGENPNDNVAKTAEQISTKEKDPKVENFLDQCISSKTHKSKPGVEVGGFSGVCVPWRSHSCCTNTTTKFIESDGAFSLYRMKWDHCKNLSKSCREYFIKDTCFYECSPNLAPWIVTDHVSKYTRSERVYNVPLCSSDCDDWFEACKDDYTCSDNWGENWSWTKKGNECKLGCKRFKDYFPNSVTFCNKIFNHTFLYTEGKPGKDCLNLWPGSSIVDLNREVAYSAAKKLLYGTSKAVILEISLNLLFIATMIFSLAPKILIY